MRECHVKQCPPRINYRGGARWTRVLGVPRRPTKRGIWKIQNLPISFPRATQDELVNTHAWLQFMTPIESF